MKIMHLMLACFYIDNYSYQENLIPKYHKIQGNDVEIVASLVSFNDQGKSIVLPNSGKYINENGIPVTRLDYKKGILSKKLRRYIGLLDELERFVPDVLFIHGVQFSDISIVVQYLKKHKDVIVYIDNHSDFSNSGTNWVSKKILHEKIWRHYANIINPYVRKFYGVLPARVDFLINEYRLPKEKVELLVMGADDDLVIKAANPEVIERVRNKYGIKRNDFLIMTGGKIDLYKQQTILLMQAIKNIDNDNVRLIVFGSVVPELKDTVESLVDGKKIIYAGWVNAEESYSYFSASDLVVFPGRHSVFWEQVTGQGKPMIVKEWDGTKHVDIGGNVRFLTHDSVDEIQELLQKLINNPEEYKNMKEIAETKGSTIFSYKEIARRSIQN